MTAVLLTDGCHCGSQCSIPSLRMILSCEIPVNVSVVSWTSQRRQAMLANQSNGEMLLVSKTKMLKVVVLTGQSQILLVLISKLVVKRFGVQM